MLYLFSFLKSLQFFGSLAVPFYLQRLGLTYTQMFLIETVFAVCLFLFEVPTGVIADKYGRKVSVFCGSLIFGISFVVIGFTTFIPLFIIAQIIASLGMSLISGADSALVYENAKLKNKTDKQAAVIASRYEAFSSAGSLIAMPVGTVFVSLFQKEGVITTEYTNSLAATFWITGFVTILSTIVILFVKEPPVSNEVKSKSAFKHALDGFTTLFKSKEIRNFSFNYSIISGLTFLMFWFYQSLLLKNNFPISIGGFISAGFNLGGMIFLFSVGFFLKHLGVKKCLVFSSFLPGLLYILLFFFPSSKPIIIITIFGIIIFKFFRKPILTTLINTKIKNEDRATILSGVSMLERIVITITYPIAGLLLDYAYNYTFLIIGLLILLVSFFVRVDNIQVE